MGRAGIARTNPPTLFKEARSSRKLEQMRGRKPRKIDSLSVSVAEDVKDVIKEEEEDMILETGQKKNEVVNAVDMVNGMLNDPQLFDQDTSSIGLSPKKCGRKRKFLPQEKLALAQLYYDNFAVYHSQRYSGAPYVTGEGNLKHWLLRNWAAAVTKMGIAERTPVEIASRLNEMILDVVEARKISNNPSAIISAASGFHMNSAFQLVDKVYNYSLVSHERIEQLLDKYEQKIVKDMEVEVCDRVKQLDAKEWTSEEKALLVRLYNGNAHIYNILPIRVKDNTLREGLLSSWANRISSESSIERSSEEVQAKLFQYRNMAYKEEEPVPRKRGRPCSRVPARLPRDVTPTAAEISVIQGAIMEVDDDMNRTLVIRMAKNLQEKIVQSGLYDKTLPRAAKDPTTLPDPPLSTPASSISSLDSHHLTIGGNGDVTRTNRPHMSRQEKHLLGLLYRRNHNCYELFNNPHIARKTPDNKKWRLLIDWSSKLTSLGVSHRQPDELATKISQYKHIIRSQKICQTEGVDSVVFSSEYKMRRCLRPLSPTTKLYDVDDKSIEESEYSEEAIDSYLAEAMDSLNYPRKSNQDPPFFEAIQTFGRANYTKKSKEADLMSQLETANQNIKTEPLESEEMLEAKEEEAPREVTVRDVLQSAMANNRCNIDISMAASEPSSSLSLAAVLAASSSSHQNEPKKMENFWETYETVVQDVDRMGNSSAVVYDSVDLSGHITRLALTRCETNRDVNYYIWTKSFDIETDSAISVYICYMCDQMSQTAAQSNNSKRYFNMIMPSQHLLAQQSTPTMAVSCSNLLVNVQWARGVPRHRCVPFLKSTICEKIAELSHIIRRIQDDQSYEDEANDVKPVLLSKSNE